MCRGRIAQRFESHVRHYLVATENGRHVEAAPRWLAFHAVFEDLLVAFAADEYGAIRREVGDAFTVALAHALGVDLGHHVTLPAFHVDVADFAGRRVLDDGEDEETVGRLLVAHKDVLAVADRGDATVIGCADVPFRHFLLREFYGLLGRGGGAERECRKEGEDCFVCHIQIFVSDQG